MHNRVRQLAGGELDRGLRRRPERRWQARGDAADDDTEQLVCRVGTLVIGLDLPENAKTALKRRV